MRRRLHPPYRIYLIGRGKIPDELNFADGDDGRILFRLQGFQIAVFSGFGFTGEVDASDVNF